MQREGRFFDDIISLGNRDVYLMVIFRLFDFSVSDPKNSEAPK